AGRPRVGDKLPVPEDAAAAVGVGVDHAVAAEGRAAERDREQRVAAVEERNRVGREIRGRFGRVPEATGVRRLVVDERAGPRRRWGTKNEVGAGELAPR